MKLSEILSVGDISSLDRKAKPVKRPCGVLELTGGLLEFWVSDAEAGDNGVEGNLLWHTMIRLNDTIIR